VKKQLAPALNLSKFDVAERQLMQALQLFFDSRDPVSIHTLAEAAAQILYDIGDAHGVRSISRDNERIRPDKKKEWLSALHRSRNFFKHADRDKQAFHEFKDIFNDMSLLDAVNMYIAIKKQWTPESLMFYVWFGLNYPELISEESNHHQILAGLRDGPYGPSPGDKARFGELVRMLRSGELSMSNLALYSGLTPSGAEPSPRSTPKQLHLLCAPEIKH
jgi:hypothetical protein